MTNNKTPVVFTGDAGDYFGIWMVNLLLSIVTLGIYSAWAKVRRKKYFYNNTLIDGVSFDYHGRPWAILKGRIIAFVLFIIYTVLSGFNPVLGALLAVLLFLAVPWIVVRGMTFNARNTSYRGLRFDFDANSWQAAGVFIGYPILVLLSLGLAMPFVAQRTNKFLFEHHKFGLSHFQMTALVKDFYLIYLKLLGVFVVLTLIISVAIKSLSGDITPPKTVSLQQTPIAHSGLMTVAMTEAAAEPPADAPSTPETDDKTTNAPTQPDPVAEAFKKYADQLGPIIYVFILMALLLYMLVIFLVMAYMQSRVTNLVLNNTTVDHVSFFSTQRMRDLVWLYLSNILLIMFSAGLATPWAQIRMARYRIQHLAISGETDWHKFVGEKKEAARAVGEELADMFDIDISFG